MRLGEAALVGLGICAGAVLAASPASSAPPSPAPAAAPPPGAKAPSAPGTPPALAPDAPLPPLSEARPALPAEPERVPAPWQHHIEVGGGVAFGQMPATVDGDGKPTPVRFKPGVGFHVDLSWQVWRYLRFTGYLVERSDGLQLTPGPQGTPALGVPGTISPASVHVYTFGVRFSPTLPIGPRVRLWLTAGAGWGYFGYGRMTVDETSACAAASTCVTLPARSATVFEVPLGLGAAFEIIPRWLSVHAEVTGAFVPSQIGDALQHGQYIDAHGLAQDLAPMPRVDASFVETLGLSVHL